MALPAVPEETGSDAGSPRSDALRFFGGVPSIDSLSTLGSLDAGSSGGSDGGGGDDLLACIRAVCGGVVELVD